MASDVLTMLALLVFGHLLADYPLQADFMAKAKNRTAPFPGVPWQTLMLSHAAIHGAIVWFVTWNALFGLAEIGLHFWIDDSKCRGRLTFNEDQGLHLFCKAAYVLGAFVMESAK